MNRALQIYKKLLSDGQINDKSDSELYTNFKDPDVRAILIKFERELGFRIIEAKHTVYLVPNSDNELFSFRMKDIRESISSSARQVDAFLQCYIIMVILHLFFGGKNYDPKQIEFLQIKDIVQKLDEKFDTASERKMDELEERYSLNFKHIANLWGAKATTQDGKRTTKNEIVLRACRLLIRQKLIDFRDNEREIKTTTRLDDLMRYYYLDEKRVSEITAVFQEDEKNAEN
ncbi:DUF6063 family protein [Acetobacterium sp.]|jgi:hypothetical protein|uniref:DUF6063 family protein n=1 Tax=Acetobacterium sp. TaxID=1872094 RepID=UPI000CC4407C|nr:DUF6063 family protein [Acetobacterium sp.]MDO9492984.1 DUF6063 family protein [Acetobacterium sp.]PKM74893.1 MAG: hypothetical protein CVU92_04135 [Firmicutes bacterium HGW-Firmicutes-17]